MEDLRWSDEHLNKKKAERREIRSMFVGQRRDETQKAFLDIQETISSKRLDANWNIFLLQSSWTSMKPSVTTSR